MFARRSRRPGRFGAESVRVSRRVKERGGEVRLTRRRGGRRAANARETVGLDRAPDRRAETGASSARVLLNKPIQKDTGTAVRDATALHMQGRQLLNVIGRIFTFMYRGITLGVSSDTSSLQGSL